MSDRPASGTILGIPYNFEPPKLTRMLKGYWQPGEGMLVPKPFGVGYTLNLANWKSWIVILVAGALVAHERRNSDDPEEEDQEPVEVLVEEE